MTLKDSLILYEKIPGAQPFPLPNFFSSKMCVSIGKRTEVMKSTEYQPSIYGKYYVDHRTDVGDNSTNKNITLFVIIS